jgi:hypothetical protein
MKASLPKRAIVILGLSACLIPARCNAATQRRGDIPLIPNERSGTASELGVSHAVALACGIPSSEAFGADSSASPAIQLSLAIADFTGDSQPDIATVNVVRSSRSNEEYVIDVQLSEGGRQSLSLSAPSGGLIITPQDVTGDGAPDLVVRRATSLAPIAIFINDGCGRFSPRDSELTSRNTDHDAVAMSFTHAREYLAACAISSPSLPIADLNGRGQRLARPAVRLGSTSLVFSPHFRESSNSGRAPPAL